MSLTYATRRALLKGAFTPQAVSGLLGWYDPSDLSTLFQDSAMSTPITADGQYVGAIRDKSGNGLHMIQPTSNSRPVYRVINGLASLFYDGVDDALYVNNVSIGGQVTISVATRKLSDAAQQFLAFYGAGQLQLRGSLAAGNGNYYARASSSGNANLSNLPSGMFAAPDTAVVMQRARLSPVSHRLRRNGVDVAVDTTTSQGSGVYGVGEQMTLGAVSQVGNGPLNGHIYGAAIYASDLTDSDAARLDNYLGRKAGLSL